MNIKKGKIKMKRVIKMKKIIVVIILVTGLVGCSGKKVTECGVGMGAGCKSVTEVNEMVTKGELGKGKIDSIKENHGRFVRLRIIEEYRGEVENKKLQNEVRRVPEQTGRVWINGFEDEMGDYIGETYLYTVIEGGRWVDVE
ncbi:TraV family lipoprotein [Candidatus Bandiella numerosa]|uniref:TraV family lipoprotein n=1 Tax=Candidatus Bandiella numerosa TaxID=2570586 RepID=UPI00249ECB1E|nr:TraV family lipoprotein [Candidatus Bandiella numerosa]WHA04576.1 TraV family lipoprotein [Candidatus Bandiella numerosa]